jgi:lysyl-tRNA synthetase class 2
MSGSERITQQRTEKLERLRARGIDPYPPRCCRSHDNASAIALLAQAEASGTTAPEVTIAGRITANRGMGKLAFMDVSDGSGKLQLFINKAAISEADAELLKDLDLGDHLQAAGRLMRTRSGEASVQVTGLTLLAKSLQPLPEKWHGLQDTELRYRQRYLDLISNPGVKEVFRKRSRIITLIRAFLDGRDFLEVETPILQPCAGGALARPFITHHNTLDRQLYLRIALELHLKRLIVGGFDRVYEIGPVFRNEGIDITHNPEFTMLECYQAYADYRDIMQLLEDMISGVMLEVNGAYQVTFEGEVIDFSPPWKRLDLRRAVLEHSGIDYALFTDTASLQEEMTRRGMEFDPGRDRGRLIDDLLSTYVEPHLVNPTFLVDYPLDMSPLAKNRPGDPTSVERFEAYAGRMEIANAFSELNDALEQQRRFARQLEGRAPTCGNEETETIDEDFLTALEHGMPPTGGLGVGIDRIVMLATGQRSIREVILFPALKEKE